MARQITGALGRRSDDRRSGASISNDPFGVSTAVPFGMSERPVWVDSSSSIVVLRTAGIGATSPSAHASAVARIWPEAAVRFIKPPAETATLAGLPFPRRRLKPRHRCLLPGGHDVLLKLCTWKELKEVYGIPYSAAAANTSPECSTGNNRCLIA